MHTFIYPISSGFNKGDSIHLCSFICANMIDGKSYVFREGTLVLDDKGYIVLNSRIVPTGPIIMKQRMRWSNIFKYDHLITKWTRRIQSDFSKGEFVTMCGSSDRVEELKICAKELGKTTEQYIVLRNAILFRLFLNHERIIWTRETPQSFRDRDGSMHDILN